MSPLAEQVEAIERAREWAQSMGYFQTLERLDAAIATLTRLAASKDAWERADVALIPHEGRVF
jgi:hypothetical protein